MSRTTALPTCAAVVLIKAYLLSAISSLPLRPTLTTSNPSSDLLRPLPHTSVWGQLTRPLQRPTLNITARTHLRSKPAARSTRTRRPSSSRPTSTSPRMRLLSTSGSLTWTLTALVAPVLGPGTLDPLAALGRRVLRERERRRGGCWGGRGRRRVRRGRGQRGGVHAVRVGGELGLWLHSGGVGGWGGGGGGVGGRSRAVERCGRYAAISWRGWGSGDGLEVAS
jgi:hypothetical protein